MGALGDGGGKPFLGTQRLAAQNPGMLRAQPNAYSNLDRGGVFSAGYLNQKATGHAPPARKNIPRIAAAR